MTEEEDQVSFRLACVRPNETRKASHQASPSLGQIFRNPLQSYSLLKNQSGNHPPYPQVLFPSRVSQHPMSVPRELSAPCLPPRGLLGASLPGGWAEGSLCGSPLKALTTQGTSTGSSTTEYWGQVFSARTPMSPCLAITDRKKVGDSTNSQPRPPMGSFL